MLDTKIARQAGFIFLHQFTASGDPLAMQESLELGDLAVIDFDDSAYGWHMYDIASALIECQFGQDCDSLQSAFLDGYRECRPLAQQDIEMFRQFELIRGMAIIGWFHQRPEYAGEAEFEKVRSWVIGECQQ